MAFVVISYTSHDYTLRAIAATGLGILSLESLNDIIQHCIGIYLCAFVASALKSINSDCCILGHLLFCCLVQVVCILHAMA